MFVFYKNQTSGQPVLCVASLVKNDMVGTAEASKHNVIYFLRAIMWLFSCCFSLKKCV